MAERRSKPRKQVVDEKDKTYNWWQLGMYLVSGIAIIFLMIIVSGFLSQSGGGPSAWLYVAFGVTALVAVGLWFGGWMAARKAA
jgi:Kef-type K+ transport system membrane component KefB